MTGIGRIRGMVLAAALVGALPARGQAKANPAGKAFIEQVEENFARWDANRDGVLQPAELDTQVDDPKLKGKAAAALAAIHAALRSGKHQLPPLAKAYFPAALQAFQQKKDSAPDYAGAYSRNLRKIEKAERRLFGPQGPALEDIHQGKLGDCFFLAPLGAAVAREQALPRRLIGPAPTGGWRVTFIDGNAATIPPLTDAELALTSTTERAGTWVNMLEKAFGQVQSTAFAPEDRKDSVTDFIAKGGSTARAMRLFTGHQAGGMGLLKKKPDGGYEPNPTANLDKLRGELKAAFAARRLVCASTPDPTTTPRLTKGHAWAVLGYNPANDTLDLWNPHGKDFAPKGPPGPQHGYATKNGRFAVPLGEFATLFRGIYWETDKPAQFKPTVPTKKTVGK